MEEKSNYEFESQIEEGIDDIDDADMTDLRFLMPILMEEEELDKLKESKEYQDGIKLGAKWAGFASVLLSAGLSTKETLVITTNQQTAENNLEMAKVTTMVQKKSNPLG